MIIDKAQAIKALRPNASFALIDEELVWHDTEQTQPTKTEINNKISELQAEYDALAYARARKQAYPNVNDFMEAYTEKEIGGNTSKWDEYVIKYNKVRKDNPK
jgi:hypothetical protein